MSTTHGKRSATFLGIQLLAFLSACSAEPKVREADEAEIRRMRGSPQWKEGSFRNPQPMWMDTFRSMLSLFQRSAHNRPQEKDLPTKAYVKGLESVGSEALRATWLGHSTVLLELDGHRVLLDPVWGERSSPVSFAGPKRWYPSLLPLAEVPRLDAVLISHNHYDHLDEGTIRALSARTERFVVPLGVGALLREWGVEPGKIQELDWWERVQVGGLEIHSTPARHASGRGLFDKDKSLWSGYALLGPLHRVYYSGDTGMTEAFDEIGKRFGSFDLTVLEIGEYAQEWPDWHMGPEQAVLAHQKVGGRVMLPVHWGLFSLSSHTWTEPIERASVAAKARGVRLATPQPGETLSISGENTELGKIWWPSLPWGTAEEYPIVSTKQGQAPVHREGRRRGGVRSWRALHACVESQSQEALRKRDRELAQLQRELCDLAFELDQRREHEASDVASGIAARVGELLGQPEGGSAVG